MAARLGWRDDVTSESTKKNPLVNELIVPSTNPLIPLCYAVRAAVFVFSVILFSRLVVIATIYVIAKGHEYTNDAIYWKRLAEDPLQLFLGWGTYQTQFPPLQPLIEALIYRPTQHWFGDFIALRFTSAVYEAIGASLLTILLARLKISAFVGLLVLATLLLNPIGWAASALWGANDLVFFAVGAAVLLLIHANRPIAAILVAGVAVVAVKIFFLVVLLPMIIFLQWGSIVTRAAIAAGPIVAAYLISFIGNLLFLGHVNFGLLAFVPNNDFAISFWSAMTVLFHWPPLTIQRQISGVLSLSTGLTLCAAIRWRRPTLRFDQLALLTAVLLMWVLFLFYHVNPEYYISLLPYCFVLVGTLFDFFFFMLLGFVCWGLKYVFTIKHQLHSTNPVQQKFVAFYLAHIPIDVNWLHPLMLIAFVIVSAIFAVRMTILLWRNVNTLPAGKAISPTRVARLPYPYTTVQ